MNTLRFELAAMGVALLGLGGFLAVQSAGLGEPAAEPVLRFTAADFHAFDRDFELHGQTCKVGFRSHRICFGESPYEGEIEPGRVLPAHMPAMSAEFRVIVETDLKARHLKTVRFGRTLALVDARTREVHDILRLDAPGFPPVPEQDA